MSVKRKFEIRVFPLTYLKLTKNFFYLNKIKISFMLRGNTAQKQNKGGRQSHTNVLQRLMSPSRPVRTWQNFTMGTFAVVIGRMFFRPCGRVQERLVDTLKSSVSSILLHLSFCLTGHFWNFISPLTFLKIACRHSLQNKTSIGCRPTNQ